MDTRSDARNLGLAVQRVFLEADGIGGFLRLVQATLGPRHFEPLYPLFLILPLVRRAYGFLCHHGAVRYEQHRHQLADV